MCEVSHITVCRPVRTPVGWCFILKDRSTGFSFSGATIAAADLFDTTDNLVQQGSAAQISSATSALTAAKGWFITLLTGEKVVISGTSVLQPPASPIGARIRTYWKQK